MANNTVSGDAVEEVTRNGCVKHFEDDRTDGLLNTGACVTWPHYVRNTIFLCGYKESVFPFHCMVGPDWAIMIMTSLLIIVPTVPFLIYVCESVSRYLTIADGILAALAVVCHWLTACIDPGTVYCKDTNLYDETKSHQEMIPVDVHDRTVSDVESGVKETVTDTPTSASETFETIQRENSREAMNNMGGVLPLTTTPPERMECNVCGITRPSTAKHCYSCNTCVDELDHHCPFTGKCIGKNNLLVFRVFVNCIGLHSYVVIGTMLYYVITSFVMPLT